jgi:hypothetical protein
MRAEHLEELAKLLAAAGRIRERPRSSSRYGSARKLYNFNVDNATRTEASTMTSQSPRRRASPRPSTTTRWRKSAAPPPPASTTSAAAAPSASCRISTTCCFSARRCRAIRWRATARSAHRSRARHALRQEADRTRDPDHHRRHELRLAVRQGQGGAGPRRDAAGTSTTTGDGGMTPEERGQSQDAGLPVSAVALRHEPDDLRKADAIEVVIGQGAKPGGGGMLLGQKISDRVAADAQPAQGIDQRSACRHPDWTGPDDLEIKIRSCARSPTGRSRST